jgi:hypothetical protein
MVMGGNKTGQVLISSAALRKVPGAQFRAIQYPMFERAVIGALSELKPADVMGKSGPDEDAVELWKGKLAAVNHNLAQTTAKAATAEDPSVYIDLLDTYGKQRKETHLASLGGRVACWQP